MQNVSRGNDLIFMPMNVQVIYILIPIVSHKDSFCHRCKSKLGIGLFIQELAQSAFDLSLSDKVQLKLPPITTFSCEKSCSWRCRDLKILDCWFRSWTDTCWF